MATSDRRKSQLMMRYRVLFQLCTVGAVVGGIYYNAYKSLYLNGDSAASAEIAPVTDNRVWLKDQAKFDLPADEGDDSGAADAKPQQELR